MAVKLALSQNKEADALLSKDPLALLIGMVLDQQVPLEWAFAAPLTLKERMGSLDAAEIANCEPELLVKHFVGPPALHRFPAANAARVQELCRIVVEQYGGKADNVWKKAKTGDELYKNVKGLPGFGEMKARIFVALLAKQLGVRPEGWEAVAKDYGKPGTLMSVADITGPETLLKVRDFKAQKKAAAKIAAGEVPKLTKAGVPRKTVLRNPLKK